MRKIEMETNRTLEVAELSLSGAASEARQRMAYTEKLVSAATLV